MINSTTNVSPQNNQDPVTLEIIRTENRGGPIIHPSLPVQIARRALQGNPVNVLPTPNLASLFPKPV